MDFNKTMSDRTGSRAQKPGQINKTITYKALLYLGRARRVK